jgi:branched-chain amino acid transport system ATP-binding protein
VSTALEARAVTRRLGDTVVVDGVDLVAESGRISVIVGPNGAGKTSLFNCLSGVDPPDSGSVVHRGEDVTGWPSDRLARRGLVRTFQHSSIFPTLRVADNLRVAVENHRRRGAWRGLLGLPDRGAERASAVVAGVLEELGLTPLADVLCGALPAGTKRLVELGRALCAQPDTLLLDEPASGLDDDETEHLHQILHRLAGSGIALVMVEHDLGLVQDTADIVHVMKAGRVVASGTPGDILHADRIADEPGRR